MKSSRETWIDYARGIAIILVVYRHAFEGIKNAGINVQAYLAIEHANMMVFSFRMPLFFIVSGVFVMGSFKKRGLKDYIITKSRTILYPYFIWGIFQITIQILLSKYINSKLTIYSYLDLLYMPRAIDQFWYLYALFNVSVLYVFIYSKFKLKAVYNMLIGCIFFLISIKAYQAKINLGFLGDVFHYYLFFSIGDLLSKTIRNKSNLKYFESWKLLLVVLFPFLVSQYIFLIRNLPYANIKYSYVEYYQPVLFIAIALIGCLFVILLSFNLQKAKLIPWLHILGRHSLYIYVAHIMVLAVVRIFMTRVLGISYVPVLFPIVVIMGLLVPIVLYKLASKLNMRWIFTLEENDKKIHYANA
jgi:fucose 4-O-acetylase-like acetyltransferase